MTFMIVTYPVRTTTIVVFDKTGTLTEGAPRVADVHVMAGSDM